MKQLNILGIWWKLETLVYTPITDHSFTLSLGQKIIVLQDSTGILILSHNLPLI